VAALLSALARGDAFHPRPAPPRTRAGPSSDLDQHLAEGKADTLVFTGAETDVCVLATVLGAVDRGYRVILVTDALCSSSDVGHDALLTLYRTRFSEQIETACVDEVLEGWH
jgi:nicotinamidase-related amidase